jgi:hypothetical protein
MTHASFIVGAWVVVAATLGLYAAHLVARGRALSRRVPAARRRWLHSEHAPKDPTP